jgi:hypothetical protein
MLDPVEGIKRDEQGIAAKIENCFLNFKADLFGL